MIRRKVPSPSSCVESFPPRHIPPRPEPGPLLRIVLAQDGNRWLLLLLFHHLVMDHTTLEVMLEEIVGRLWDLASHCLPRRRSATLWLRPEEAFPLRNTRLSSATCWATMETPTLPFGLVDVLGDGLGIARRAANCPRIWRCDYAGRAAGLGRAGETVSSGMGAGIVALLQSGRRGLRHGTVWPAAGGRRRRAGAGDVHQHLAGAHPVRCATGGSGAAGNAADLLRLMRHEHASLAWRSAAARCRARAPVLGAAQLPAQSAGKTQPARRWRGWRCCRARSAPITRSVCRWMIWGRVLH